MLERVDIAGRTLFINREGYTRGGDGHAAKTTETASLSQVVCEADPISRGTIPL